jgi:integrase
MPAAHVDVSPPVVTARAALSAELEGLAGQARTYAAAKDSANTARAYASDWRQFESWCRRQGLDAGVPDAQIVGLYLAAEIARRGPGGKPITVSTLERRLAAVTAHYRSAGAPLDRGDRHIVDVLAGIRRTHGRPPRQKEAVLAKDVLDMVATLDQTLRGLRDRAILLMGFAGGLRRSEIVGLDLGPDQTLDGTGWIEMLAEGLLLHIKGKTGWRVVEVGRGSSACRCPVAALETWIRLGRLAHGAVFRRVLRENSGVGPDRLNDRHVARLVQRAALAAGVRGDLPEGERYLAFAGHSLRAGLASSAEVDERYVQGQLGHASAEMTRRYQRRRDRFRVNLTKAAGL